MAKVIYVTSERNNRPPNDELVKMIKSSNGCFFSCKTLKDDGSVRHWVARVRVKKGVKGTSTRKQKDNLVTVFDMQINQFRTLDTNKLLSFNCGLFEWCIK